MFVELRFFLLFFDVNKTDIVKVKNIYLVIMSL